MRFGLSLIVTALLVGSSAAPMRADEAAWVSFTIHSTDCDTPPLSQSAIDDLVERAERTDIPVQPAYTWAKRLPTGVLVDEATEHSIEDAVRQFFACATTSSTLQADALFSERYLVTGFRNGMPPSTADGSRSATPEARPPVEATILVLSDLQRLKDGKISAPVAFYPDITPGADPTVRILVFTWEDNSWKVDEIITYVKAPGKKIPDAVSEVLPPID